MFTLKGKLKDYKGQKFPFNVALWVFWDYSDFVLLQENSYYQQLIDNTKTRSLSFPFTIWDFVAHFELLIYGLLEKGTSQLSLIDC